MVTKDEFLAENQEAADRLAGTLRVTVGPLAVLPRWMTEDDDASVR